MVELYILKKMRIVLMYLPPFHVACRTGQETFITKPGGWA